VSCEKEGGLKRGSWSDLDRLAVYTRLQNKKRSGHAMLLPGQLCLPWRSAVQASVHSAPGLLRLHLWLLRSQGRSGCLPALPMRTRCCMGTSCEQQRPPTTTSAWTSRSPCSRQTRPAARPMCRYSGGIVSRVLRWHCVPGTQVALCGTQAYVQVFRWHCVPGTPQDCVMQKT